MEIEEIKKCLKDRKLTTVSRVTHIHLQTLYKIMRNECKATKSTKKLLELYLAGRLDDEN